MNKNEIYEYVYKILENYEFDQKSVIGTIRNEISEEWLPLIKDVPQRMDEIEEMIHAHAVGVQNVYSKVEKIEKTLELSDVKKEIEEIYKYMNSERVEHEKKAVTEKELAAFEELKTGIVKLMFAFNDKYSSEGENCIYPKAGSILVDVLMACLSEAQYQIQGHPRFTSKQIDHICYQIGDWYLMMKPLLEGQHNLGHMKEKLKIMICGE